MITNNNILTLKEAAAFLNMGYETLRYYVTRNRGPEFTRKNKMRLFTPENLEEWNKNRKRKKMSRRAN